LIGNRPSCATRPSKAKRFSEEIRRIVCKRFSSQQRDFSTKKKQLVGSASLNHALNSLMPSATILKEMERHFMQRTTAVHQEKNRKVDFPITFLKSPKETSKRMHMTRLSGKGRK
jgi:hypothetical protein